MEAEDRANWYLIILILSPTRPKTESRTINICSAAQWRMSVFASGREGRTARTIFTIGPPAAPASTRLAFLVTM